MSERMFKHPSQLEDAEPSTFGMPVMDLACKTNSSTARAARAATRAPA